jgi:hypothetical protein
MRGGTVTGTTGGATTATGIAVGIGRQHCIAPSSCRFVTSVAKPRVIRLGTCRPLDCLDKGQSTNVRQES